MEELRKKFSFLTNSSIYVYSLIGLILIGFGVLAYKIDIFSSGDVVEVLQTTTEVQDSDKEIVVEISGSVEKPGVYSFKEGSRVDDLLIAAGGLSADADRDWVTKNINRAAKLNDGQKIYIYSQSEVISAKNNGGIKVYQDVLGNSVQNLTSLVNINTASQKELEKLVGIGPVYAQSIIEHRPYSTSEELVKRQIIPQKTFQKIQNEITVY